MKKYICSVKSFLFPAVIILLRIACGCSSDKTETHRQYIYGADSMTTLAGLNGSDMTFYHLYLKQIEDNAMEAASASAETFLSGLDSNAAHPAAARLATWLSDYYANDRNLFSVAADWGEKALRMYGSLNWPEQAASVSFRLGKLYRELNRYDMALFHALPALSYFENNGDTVSSMLCYNLLGQIYHFCQEPETSLTYFEKYESAARMLRDTLNMAYALNNLAVMTGSPEDTLRSRQLLREASRMAMEHKDTIAYINIFQSQAVSYVNTNEKEKIEKFLPLLVQIPDYLDNTKDRIKYYYCLGSVYYRLDRLEDAANALETAIKYCSEGEFSYHMQSCYYMLQGVFYRTGNIEKAYECLLNYTYLYRKTMPLDSYIQLFKYQNELQLSQERDRMKERRSRYLITGISIGFAFILLLTVAWAVLWRQRLKVIQKESELKNRQLTQENREQEINAQNEILEMRRMQQYQLDRVIQDVIGQLQKISRKYPDLPVKEELDTICSDLQSDNAEQWNELNQFVPKFNSMFFQKLLQDYPDLTINERRLCALLNMNMTTKEISEITRQSVHSINIARGRLRSKLGIIGERVSIQEFLARYN